MGSLKEKLEKRKKKKAKRTNEDQSQNEVILKKEETGNGDIKSIGKKKRKREKENNVDDGKAVKIKDNLIKAQEENIENRQKENKRKNKRRINSPVGNSNHNDDGAAEHSSFKSQGNIDNFNKQREAVTEGGKSKKSKKKEHHTRKESEIIREERENAVEDDVFCISSGEEDGSKGMRKWITEYHQSRPGLKVLQESIDQFITAHEEKLEQERKEREARAAEDGWTVVVHHKGRKKTTDSESGVTVGSVAPAVVESQLAKKKQKDVGPNFYRFQKRDARRNEILALQSKFENNRKQIQELRAARKFRPY